MLNRILYQWLNRQHGNTGMQSGIVDVNLSLQFRTEPEFLNFQVSQDNFHLLLDFDKCAIRAQKVAKHLRQIQDQLPGFAVAAIYGSVKRV